MFEEVYSFVFAMRNEYSQIQYPALFRVMDLMGLTPDQQLDIIEKTAAVESIVVKHLNTKSTAPK